MTTQQEDENVSLWHCISKWEDAVAGLTPLEIYKMKIENKVITPLTLQKVNWDLKV